MSYTRPNLLVSGFEAFEEFDRNPSEDIAAFVNNRCYHKIQVIGLSLPVSWKRAWPLLLKSVLEHKPVGLLMLGLAPGDYFRFERTAINKNDRFLDNDRALPGFPFVVSGGSDQIRSALPLEWLLAQLQEYPASPLPKVCYSEDAGGYLCNNVFYRAMHHLEQIVPWRGFIHVPPYVVSTNDTSVKEESLEIGIYLVERFSFWLSEKQQHV